MSKENWDKMTIKDVANAIPDDLASLVAGIKWEDSDAILVSMEHIDEDGMYCAVDITLLSGGSTVLNIANDDLFICDELIDAYIAIRQTWKNYNTLYK